MAPLALEHVCALPNPLAPRDGTLAHALEWASCLRLPLEILDPSSATTGRRNTGQQIIPCETVYAAESGSLPEQLFRPHGLSVFSDTLPAEVKDRLVHSSLHSKQNAILVCSSSGDPLSRVLILHAGFDGENGFLRSALSLCRLFRVTPVILTMARNELKARQAQRIAEAACLQQRISAHLDYVVGRDLRTAVSSIARWRRCSHVFMARRQAIPWWRWHRGDMLKTLLESNASLSFLALPESGVRLPDSALQSQEVAVLPIAN